MINYLFPQEIQHLRKFYITLLLLIAIVILHLYFSQSKFDDLKKKK